MATATLIPVTEYLATTYHPDCDYLNGETKERNVGEGSHGRLQLLLGALFEQHAEAWNTCPVTEQRVQVAPTRYRVPDLVVLQANEPWQEVVRTPPLLCVEVLSRSDTFTELQERVDDYAAMGVPNIWAVSPWQRAAYYASPQGFRKSDNNILIIPNTAIRVDLAPLFAKLPEQP